MNRVEPATQKSIDRYRTSQIGGMLCGDKPFGSRHWEYPWTVEQSGLLNHKNLRILDVAPDFTFPYADFLAKNHQVTFIDLARRKWSDTVVWGADVADLASRSDLRIMDVRQMEFQDETFDLIFCISVLEHIVCPTQNPDHPDLKKIFDPKGAISALKEMHRCLKPRGKLLLTIDIYGGKKWGPLFRQWNIFKDLDKAGFSIRDFPSFNYEERIKDPTLFISHFHGPYMTLGFSLEK